MPTSDTSPSVKVELVDPHNLGRIWPDAWKWLEAAVPEKFLDEWAVQERIRNRDWDLWVVTCEGKILGALTTELLCYPLGSVFRILNCGGRGMTGARAQAIWERLEIFARDCRCDRIEIVGRRGWGRLFPDTYIRATIFAKELT